LRATASVRTVRFLSNQQSCQLIVIALHWNPSRNRTMLHRCSLLYRNSVQYEYSHFQCSWGDQTEREMTSITAISTAYANITKLRR